MTTNPESVWADRWREAIETGAFGDPTHAAVGERSALSGEVTIDEIAPGLVEGRVGEERTQLSIEQLDAERWHTLLDAVSTDARAMAQFLAGRLPDVIGGAAMPVAGDVVADCSCDDWIDLCRHGAALANAVGLLLDEDPFAMLLLRGRSRGQLTEEVRTRRARALGVSLHPPGHARGPDPGMAGPSLRRRDPAPLPEPMRLGPEPGSLRRLGTPPPAGSGVDIVELQELVDDAASRAHAMLAQGASSGLDLRVGRDVARRAVNGDLERISVATRLPIEELTRAAIAWRLGGEAALAVSQQTSPVEATEAEMMSGVSALGPSSRVRGNTVSLGNLQLRRDGAGRWWRMEADESLGWIVAAPHERDPADLVDPSDPTRRA